MNLEQLKAALANQEITQAEYDSKVAELEGKKDEKKDNSQVDINSLLENEEFKSFLNKTIQSAEDKIRTKYTSEKKSLQDELDNIKKEKLTDQERFELEKQEFAEEKRKHEQERLNIATESLVLEQGFAKELSAFIPGSDIEKRKENLQLFMENIFKPAVEKAVKDKFGEQNHNYEEGKEAKGKTWETMTWEERIELTKTNPEEASKYLK